MQQTPRGRRGTSPTPLTDDEYWTLGQHYGLATPLLDWTGSPFIAAFFALHEIPFLKPSDVDLSNGSFSIFALNRYAIIQKADEIKLNEAMNIKVIEPLTDDNPRLVNQNGIFTKLPSNTDLESWIKKAFEGDAHAFALVKFTIPYKTGKNKSVNDILLSLARMNINACTVCASVKGPKADGIAYPKVARYNDHIIVKEKDVSLKNDPALTGS